MDKQDATSFSSKSENLVPQWVFKLNVASSAAETWHLEGDMLMVSHL
jgi:hypothetical protein